MSTLNPHHHDHNRYLNRSRHRTGLLRYWSIRYFGVVISSMALIVAATLYTVYNSNLDQQVQSLEQIVRIIAKDVEQRDRKLPEGLELVQYLSEMSELVGLDSYRSIIYRLDGMGKVQQQYPSTPAKRVSQIIDSIALSLDGKMKILRYDPERDEDGDPMLVAIHPIGMPDDLGYIVYMMPLDNLLKAIADIRFVRLAGGFTMVVVGWGVIYLMTRRLVRPLREVVRAARQIVTGNYEIELNTREQHAKEIDELMHAFVEMADRLKRLEGLRRQLLAGVTHELKTPITSISGLVQAVRDDVVSGEEAKMFLDNTLKQTKRLEKMVMDLLNFNSFASSSMTVRTESIDLKLLLEDVIGRWCIGWESRNLETIAVELLAERSSQVVSDPERIEQIVVNLLNNARDEMPDGGLIRITLSYVGDEVCIIVTDTGPGIPEHIHTDIFEPFYRGERKKHRVHGLGLGLPFSRLIARSLGGDLLLTSTSDEGTSFTLTLPRQNMREKVDS